MIAVGLGCLVLSVAVTWSARELARRKHLLDRPNARSAHKTPTPRLGGLGIVVPFLAGSLFVVRAASDGQARAFSAVLLGTAAMAVLGLVDDVTALRARWKFLGQILAAVGVVAAVGDVPEKLGPLGMLLPSFVTLPAAVLWIAWVTNLYNFMDGIDGIAGGQAVLACAGLGLAAVMVGEPLVAASLLFLGLSAVGFLVFNFPPASIFMGDVGSTAIGFFLACVPFLTDRTTLPVEAVALAIAMFLLDATVTLARRVSRSERFFEAHRSHFYQRPLACGVAHKPITLTAYAAMAFVALGAAAYPVAALPQRAGLLMAAIALFVTLTRVVLRLERSHGTFAPVRQ
jgi:Fuc2NAc and GlcNAc transferase